MNGREAKGESEERKRFHDRRVQWDWNHTSPGNPLESLPGEEGPAWIPPLAEVRAHTEQSLPALEARCMFWTIDGVNVQLGGGARSADQLAERIGQVLATQQPGGDREGEVLPILAIRCRLVAIHFEEHQARAEGHPLVPVVEGMVAAKVIEIGGGHFDGVGKGGLPAKGCLWCGSRGLEQGPVTQPRRPP